MEGQRLLERILDAADDPTDLPFALLKHITDDFSPERKIGEGGFGEVYKGVLGELTVAVKRIHINIHTFDDMLFRREVTGLMKINYRNIVRFLGVCSQGYQKPIDQDGSGEYIWANVLERLLCFEYISNGSLDKHITDELRGLEWETRYEIIIGICKGLLHLHKEKNIIHMDFKPANILLDHKDENYMVPKITDFGLSRPNKNSHTVGLCFGTLEYLAPEYREERKTTPACDIYSLGLIIIELVTGCKDIPDINNVLRRWRHRWNKPPTQQQYQQVIRCINIAERCREQNPETRPSISKIISYLSESESTHGQIIPCLDQNDMLGINPLELRLPSELKEEVSCFKIELTNDTRSWIAFNIQWQSRKQYNAQPEKGIVQPESLYVVTITVQARNVRENDHPGNFIVQSRQVEASEDITEQMFEKTSKFVDKVVVMVVYEPTKPQENRKRREGTNMPVEEVPEAKQRKIVQILPTTKLFTHISYQHKIPRGREPSRGHARGAMGSLLDKLGKLITGDYSLDTSIKRDIESFSVQLANMHRGLTKLEIVKVAKIWVDEVRELSYHIEDIVDSFLVRRSGLKEIMHESVILLENGMTNQHHMGDVIRDIKEKVQDVADRKKEYNIDVNNVVVNETTKVTIDPRMAVCRNKKQLIGIEAPRDELIQLFEEDGDVLKQDLRIVSIVGMGGMGKTTLARAVYDELKGYPTKAFVPVGQNLDLTRLLKKIIRDCQGQEYTAKKLDNLDEWQLISELHDFLHDKRYFIVIDDLWDCMLWDTINSAFPRNNYGSRVITTTRIQEVVDRDTLNEQNKVYKIKPLNDEASRSLLFRRVLGPGNNCNVTPGKEEISKDILKRCGGMPLAINSIASHLARHPSESSWEDVRKSLGAIQGNDIEKMKQILDLSYIHLPDHLKTCLLHVCMYPEDREINKNDLLRQWVAEGFVSTDEGLDAEDVAEEYFKALVDMFMIQPGQIDDLNNEVLSCKVHDITLELLRSKSSKEKFTHVIDGLKVVSGQIRRVSIEDNDKKDSRILETINKGSLEHVRSVLLHRASLLPHFLKYNYVRVLHIYKANYGGLLDLTGISRLFLLRYLKIACPLSFNCQLMLPEQIGELQQLETIDIYGGNLENYPSDIVDLPCLSHLIFSGVGRGVVLPDEIGRLKSLRTLVGICVSGSSVENIKCLSELNNLRELRIREPWTFKLEEATSMRMEALHYSICKLSATLRILYLTLEEDETWTRPCRYYWSSSVFPQVSNIRDLDLGFCSFRRCPGWIGQLHNLYKLRIVVREVADGVSIVAGLPSLAYFELYTDRFVKKEETVVISGSSGAFKALKELRFFCSKTLLTFEAGAFPKLEKLDILFRYHMARRFLPVGIQHLPSTTLKEICLGMDDDDFSEKLPEHWDTDEVNAYWDSDEYYDRFRVHDRRFRIMLTRAFKPHRPAADIFLYHLGDLDNVDDCEYYEGIDDEVDCCSLEDFYSEEDDDGGYEVSGSETSAQVQTNTRKVVLIEAQEDSGRMSTSTDVPPTSVHLAVGSEGQQSRHTDLESLQSFYLEPELPGQGPNSESLELPFPCLPSYLESELFGQVHGLESLQLPCTSMPSCLQLRQPPTSVNLAVGSDGQNSGHTDLESLQHFYLEPISELSGLVPNWESLEVPFPRLPSCLELTQPRSELSGQVQHLEDLQLPCTSISSYLQLTHPRSELLYQGPDWEFSELPFASLPSYLDMTATQSRSELSGQVQDLESSQLPCPTMPSFLQLTELFNHAPTWESLELHFPTLPSYLEMTQPRSELSGQVDDLESWQPPCTSAPCSLQLTQPELNQAPNELNDEEF